MLVLSRRIGERLIIDGGIEVVVQRVQGNRVTLGIVAPRNVSILRSELAFESPTDRSDRALPEAAAGTPTVAFASQPAGPRNVVVPLELSLSAEMPSQPR